MNVLSLFDGSSCAMLCLDRAGIKIDNYFASEIKKSAIRCSTLLAEKLDVNLTHLGDCKIIDYSVLPKIDILCAGFPCQDYSVANSKKQGIKGKNGMFFWEVVRALKELNPKFIILENVQTIPIETLHLIQKETKCYPIKINPVEMGFACQRKRLFFTNFIDVFTQTPIYQQEKVADLLDDDAKTVCHKRIGDETLIYKNTIPTQMRINGAIRKNQIGKHGEGTVIGVYNKCVDSIKFSKSKIATQTTHQPTRGQGSLIKVNNTYRNPTQAELARFHHYPVEIMQQFSNSQAQDLMGDGWHCGSCQWIFDEIKNN